MASVRKIRKRPRRSQASMREFRLGEMIVRVSVSRADQPIRKSPRQGADRARSVPPSAKKALTIGALLRSGLVGMWADRKEMSDAAGYVRSLRKGWDRRRHATGESR